MVTRNIICKLVIKMIDIFSLTTNKLVEKLKEGEISSVEVCTQYIDRIKKFEKDVKAWAHFDKKELLEKAEKQMNIENQENH